MKTLIFCVLFKNGPVDFFFLLKSDPFKGINELKRQMLSDEHGMR